MYLSMKNMHSSWLLTGKRATYLKIDMYVMKYQCIYDFLTVQFDGEKQKWSEIRKLFIIKKLWRDILPWIRLIEMIVQMKQFWDTILKVSKCPWTLTHLPFTFKNGAFQTVFNLSLMFKGARSLIYNQLRIMISDVHMT